MGAQAEAMNSVLPKFLVGKEEHNAKENTERVQSVIHGARYGFMGVRYINGGLPHGFSLGLQDKYVLTSHTTFRRFKVHLKIRVPETRVSAIELHNLQRSHQHLVPTVSQIFLRIMRLS